jgi:hypothetical protein
MYALVPFKHGKAYHSMRGMQRWYQGCSCWCAAQWRVDCAGWYLQCTGLGAAAACVQQAWVNGVNDRMFLAVIQLSVLLRCCFDMTACMFDLSGFLPLVKLAVQRRHAYRCCVDGVDAMA